MRSEKAIQAIASLLTCPTIKEAAAACGVGESTLHAWMREDEGFKEMLEEARRELRQSTMRALGTATSHALTVVTEILTDPTNAPQVRLNAAGLILANAVKLYEHGNLIERREVAKSDPFWNC